MEEKVVLDRLSLYENLLNKVDIYFDNPDLVSKYLKFIISILNLINEGLFIRYKDVIDVIDDIEKLKDNDGDNLYDENNLMNNRLPSASFLINLVSIKNII